jgi:hypothetical protein
MLRCASSFVIAAYPTVRLIPQDSRALPADILRSRPIFSTFKTFYGFVCFEKVAKRRFFPEEGISSGVFAMLFVKQIKAPFTSFST